MRYVRGRNGVLLLTLGMPFAKALQAEWRTESSWQPLLKATVLGALPLLLVCREKEFYSTPEPFSCLSVSSQLCPILRQELLDSTFSWYHGASVFPLMPSQEDKDDEGEDEEPTTKKAKKKTPGEESRPPPDLARHDVIKVDGNLPSSP